MPSWLKILLIVLGVIVVVIGGSALGIYVWWQNQGSALISSVGEGTRFGKDKDRSACVDEAVCSDQEGGRVYGRRQSPAVLRRVPEGCQARARVLRQCSGQERDPQERDVA